MIKYFDIFLLKKKIYGPSIEVINRGIRITPSGPDISNQIEFNSHFRS